MSKQCPVCKENLFFMEDSKEYYCVHCEDFRLDGPADVPLPPPPPPPNTNLIREVKQKDRAHPFSDKEIMKFTFCPLHILKLKDLKISADEFNYFKDYIIQEMKRKKETNIIRENKFSEEEWITVWDDRKKEYIRIFGTLPSDVQGGATSLILIFPEMVFATFFEFPPSNKNRGWMHITAELTNPEHDQVKQLKDESMGYGIEFLIRSPTKNEFIANFLACFPRYIVLWENYVDYEFLMDVSDIFPPDSSIKGILIVKPRTHDHEFRLLGYKGKLLLLLGVTEDELRWAQEINIKTSSSMGASMLTEILYHYKVAPMTVYDRPSIFLNKNAMNTATSMSNAAMRNQGRRIMLDKHGNVVIE